VALCVAKTASGNPCKSHAMQGSDRCAQHVGITGRKSTLTDEITEQLTSILRAGNYVTVACRAVGVSRDTFVSWMRRGVSELEADAPFREFRARVQRARAEGEVRNVAQIAKAAAESWQAAAWLLERQYPDRWGRPTTRPVVAPDEEPVAAPESEPDDPFREVDELAARRRKR
jgi:hypothetical protein